MAAAALFATVTWVVTGRSFYVNTSGAGRPSAGAQTISQEQLRKIVDGRSDASLSDHLERRIDLLDTVSALPDARFRFGYVGISTLRSRSVRIGWPFFMFSRVVAASYDDPVHARGFRVLQTHPRMAAGTQGSIPQVIDG